MLYVICLIEIFLNEIERLLPKVLGKVWPDFKNKYDLDIYDLTKYFVFSRNIFIDVYYIEL